MLLFNLKALLSQWKSRDAAVNYMHTYRNLQRHRAVLPAISTALVKSSFIKPVCARNNMSTT